MEVGADELAPPAAQEAVFLGSGGGGVEDQVAHLGAGGDEGRVDLGLVALLTQAAHGFGEFALDDVLVETAAARLVRALVVGHLQPAADLV